MALAAAFELAKAARDRGISATSILPGMDEWEVYPRVAAATAMKAQEEVVARLSKSADQVDREARQVIQQARAATQVLMREGIIPPPPEAT